MAIEFYDVKKREKVQIPESEVKKTTYERQGKDGKTQVRYAFKAVIEIGRASCRERVYSNV